jgi:hypothetical protein
MHTYKKYQLSDLDFSDAAIVRDKRGRVAGGINQGRVTYLKGDLYYKVFDEGYVRRKIFSILLKRDFFKEVAPALVGIIYDDKKVMGYVAKSGKVLSDNEFDTHLIPDDFREKVYDSMKKNKIVFYDFVPSNIIDTDGELSLIDLESVYPMEQSNELVDKHNAKYKPAELRKLVNGETGKNNIIFIHNILLKDRPERSEPYKYSIDSWKRWADGKGYDLFLCDELIYPTSEMKIPWQRYYLFDILESSGITDYNQICIVDADTIIHPDTPDFFDETEGKYCGVSNNGSYEWVLRSMELYSKNMFDGEWPFKPWEYINSGFQVVNESHKPFFEKMKSYYLDNQEEIKAAEINWKVGSDQTPLNFLLRLENVDMKLLPICYNFQDLHSKQLLYLADGMWFPDELLYLKCGWIYHFNAIPKSPLNRGPEYWIERTYRELFE